MSFQLRDRKTVLSIAANTFFWGSHLQRGQSQCSFQALSKLDAGPSFWVSHTQTHHVFHVLDWFCFVELNINSFERDCSDCMDQALTMVHTAEQSLLNLCIHLRSLENSFIPRVERLVIV